jgi:hypothetical protein
LPVALLPMTCSRLILFPFCHRMPQPRAAIQQLRDPLIAAGLITLVPTLYENAPPNPKVLLSYKLIT